MNSYISSLPILDQSTKSSSSSSSGSWMSLAWLLGKEIETTGTAQGPPCVLMPGRPYLAHRTPFLESSEKKLQISSRTAAQNFTYGNINTGDDLAGKSN